MKTFVANNLLNTLERQTESILNKAISDWQMMNNEVLSFKSEPAKWSAKQCLMHLNSYGDYYLPAIEKALVNTKHQQPSTLFRSGWLGNYFAELMQVQEDGSLKKKMKAPSNHTFNNEDDSNVVVAKFIDQQEKLLQLTALCGKVNLNKIKIPITIAPFIRLKLGDTLRFLVAHNMRHVQQAEAAVAAAIREKQSPALFLEQDFCYSKGSNFFSFVF